VDVLDYESIPTTNNSKELLGQKNSPDAFSHFFPSVLGSVLLAKAKGPIFPPRHANGLNELPLRGVIIPGMNDFFKPNDLRDRRDPNNFEEFLSTACRT